MNSAHPADSAIFGHLWTTPEASALFSDEARTQSWLQILAALAQAQADVGLVPLAAAEAIRAHADVGLIDLDLPADRTNPNGSGISLGHPLGATGAIVTVKALHELHRIGGKYALVTMCIGGGQGIAAIFEAIN